MLRGGDAHHEIGIVQPGQYNKICVQALDIRVTDRCPLDCDFCWALAPRDTADNPDHADSLDGDPQEVDDLLEKMQGYPMRKAVFTGGEPSVYRHLAGRLAVARQYGYSTVVSTAGMHPKRLEAISPHATRIDVAIDGPDAESHARMRRGAEAFRGSHVFDQAVETILRRQADHRRVGVRTMLTKDNADAAHLILPALQELGVYVTSKLRWKVYQRSPVGPRSEAFAGDGKDITPSKLLQVMLRAKRESARAQVVGEAYMQATHRGLYVRPNGAVYTVKIHDETLRPTEVELGNAFTMSEPEILRAFAKYKREARSYELTDVRTGLPVDMPGLLRQMRRGELDDWLDADEPERIVYDQPQNY